MLQSTTIDSRQSNLNTDLTATVGTTHAVGAKGDFARGQRHDIGRAHVIYGDFATGMRATSTLRVTRDFATGTHTSPRRPAIGDFATGMRALAAPAITNDARTADSALPIAA